MSGVEDASGERRVNWDKEIEAGNLVRKERVGHREFRDAQHVQGVPLTDAEARARVKPLGEVKRAMEEAQGRGESAIRPPDPPSGRSFFMGGWPDLRRPEGPTI